jgi:hypothetical protein
VAWLTAGLVALIATAAFTLAGPAQAAGALVGGAITVANFFWLRWTAGLVLRRAATPSGGPLRRVVWVGATGARFGAVALAFGLAAGAGWLGLVGLLVALAALPVAVVTEGLRVARLA